MVDCSTPAEWQQQALIAKVVCCVYVAGKPMDGFVPRVRDTVTYIVCSVLLNDRNDVLMVQEAKMSCRGKWYLPAGRMECNETIEVCCRKLSMYLQVYVILQMS